MTPVPWRLLFAHLRQAWFRTLLTAAGVALAIFLLVLLRTVVTELESGVKYAQKTRVITTSATSIFVPLPEKFRRDVQSVPGIVHVTHWTWFGGVYIDDDHMFPRFAVDVPSLRRVYGDLSLKNEVLLSPEEWQAFEDDRKGCIVGAALARTYGFAVGDHLALKGNIYPGDYDFVVRGIYERGSPQIDEASMFFHWKYLDESTGRPGVVSLFVATVDPTHDTGAVTRAIDAHFESSAHRTITQTEAAFNQSWIAMWGNVPIFLSMIGSAVLFAAFLIAVNTMLLSARDRRIETGVLKALGFPDRTIVRLWIAEGLVVCGTGGALGAAGAYLIFTVIGVDGLYRFFPSFTITEATMGLAVGTALVVGFVSGLVPAVLSTRLRVMDALARFG